MWQCVEGDREKLSQLLCMDTTVSQPQITVIVVVAITVTARVESWHCIGIEIGGMIGKVTTWVAAGEVVRPPFGSKHFTGRGVPR